MAINYPTSLDSFPNPTSTDLLENATTALDHDVQHSNANDAIEALEAKVGINSSAVTTSHDYKLSAVTSSEKALTSGTSTQSVTDLTLVTPLISFGSDATGDMIYRNGSGETARLPIGTDGQILEVSATGIPEWVDNPAVSDASTTQAGVVELATTAETETGTDATRAVTPDGLHDMTTLAGAAWFLDEDTMSSDSATKTASQQSIKAYVDSTTFLLSQIVHVPNVQTTPNHIFMTTAYTGVSSSNPIFTAAGGSAGGNVPTVARFVKTGNGGLVRTHKIEASNFGTDTAIAGIAVVGSYVYVHGSSGGATRLIRLAIADLTGETLMTQSGTSMTVGTTIFSDGTNLYNIYTNNTAKIYTISGTTVTSGADTSYDATLATTSGTWCDGTSVYQILVGGNLYKWALSGGARTSGSTFLNTEYLLSGTAQSQGGGIFKEVGNSTYIHTFMGNITSANQIGTIVQKAIF